MATQMYPKFKEALLRDSTRPFIEKDQYGWWRIYDRIHFSDPNWTQDFNIKLCIDGPYTWRWKAKFIFWLRGY